MMKKPVIKVEIPDVQKSSGKSRRNFLKLGGMAVVGTSLFLYSCEDESLTDEELLSIDAKGGGTNNKRVFNLGKGDLSILNYAYILEQLEAEFYTRVLEGSYFRGLSEGSEKQIFLDLYYHEVIHREFFKAALNTVAPPGKIAPDLKFDFSEVDFSSRDTVLQISQILEDTGVAAYNGAGKLLESTDYLLVAGKIVSVEARHASAIRNLIDPGTTNFASNDVLVDLGGSGIAYDKALTPRTILESVAATGFIETKIIANNVPTA